MPDSCIEIPRILIAALRGGSGKTVISIGIIAALCNSGKTVLPFKKGPDYIDAGWLAMAAGQPCYNLDTFMVNENVVCRSFLSHTSFSFASSANSIAVIEGNRGLYDGLDVDGTTSTASLAKLLNTPVILCLDCTKTTRTMAAVVLGCLHFDPKVNIQGVILNRVAGARHEDILRQSIEKHCHIPVIGAVPKLKASDFPERHMGLIPTPEHSGVKQAIDVAAKVVAEHVDLSAVFRIAAASENKPVSCGLPAVEPISVAAEDNYMVSCQPIIQTAQRRPRIGIARDSAFQFYYPDNIQALVAAGAELVMVSPLSDSALPEIDALYIGGGFPETHSLALSQNVRFKNDLRLAAESGLPIYAECGGLMYLGESLVLDQPYTMTGVLPIVFGFSKKPQGHGYTIATVDGNNPFFEIGTILKGHEFHYSRVLSFSGDLSDMAFAMEKGRGIIHLKDGICYKNVLATYTHIHAAGMPQWAESMVRLAKKRVAV
jgi:cobyrinic acid a,c-diamide synthase